NVAWVGSKALAPWCGSRRSQLSRSAQSAESRSVTRRSASGCHPEKLMSMGDVVCRLASSCAASETVHHGRIPRGAPRGPERCHRSSRLEYPVRAAIQDPKATTTPRVTIHCIPLTRPVVLVRVDLRQEPAWPHLLTHRP